MTEKSGSLVDRKHRILSGFARKLLESVRECTGTGANASPQGAVAADPRFPGDVLERLTHREARRQRNLDATIGQALQEKPGAVSDHAVDPDWVACWSQCCQDVSDVRLQRLWAKMLGSEVACPGSFRRRTLMVASQMDAQEAALFRAFCTYVWVTPTGLVHLRTAHTDDYLEGAGMPYAALLDLRAAGLLETSPGLGFDIRPEQRMVIQYYDERYHVGPGEGLGPQRIEVAALTRAGAELAPIMDAGPDDRYKEVLLASWRSRGILGTRIGAPDAGP
ncbi:MAG: DUF2806 domain-containing protein [Betaproteobacteria bacterium]|nr:DUF2806 domain-containing protein [Betaproteobacteria bacterium]